MRAQAKHGLFYNDFYYGPGEVFEAADCDKDMLEGMVTIVVPPTVKPEATSEEEPKKPAVKRTAKTAKSKK